jgi:hypothetical protein
MEKLVKYGTEFIFYIALKTAGSDAYQVNPTIAAGDVKVTQDGVDFGNIDTIPVVTPAGGTQVKVTVSVAELTGKQIQIQFIDAAGAEWKADTINISTYGHASAQHPFFGEGLFDRVLDSSTHNINKSFGRRIRELLELGGYEGGFIYYDSEGGVAGDEPFVNGTLDKPVDNETDLLTLKVALKVDQVKIKPGSTLTLTAAHEKQQYIGEAWTLILGNQSISGSFYHGATSVNGICTGAIPPKFCDSIVGNITAPPSSYHKCGFAGTFTAGAAGDFFFVGDSHSAVAGTGTPSFDYGAAIGATNFNFRGYHGGMGIKNMKTGDNLSFDGDGQIIIDASCTGGTIRIAGHQKITGAAAFIAAGGVIEDSARFATDQLAGIAQAGADGDTLKDISDQLDAISGGVGAFNIIVQFYETGGTTPMIGVDVSIFNEAMDAFIERKTTDVNGQLLLSMDASTYKLMPKKAACTFDLPQTIVVTQDETFIRYGDVFTIPLPSDPDQCNVYCNLKDIGLNPEEGVLFTAVIQDGPVATGNIILDAREYSQATDVQGVAILTLAKNQTYTVSSLAFVGASKAVEVVIADEDTLNLSTIMQA